MQCATLYSLGKTFSADRLQVNSSYWHRRASVINEACVALIEENKKKYSEEQPSQCQSIHHIFHTDMPGFETTPPRQEVGN